MNDNERLNQSIDLATQLRENILYFCNKYDLNISSNICDKNCPLYNFKTSSIFNKCDSAILISRLKKVGNINE